MKNSSFLAMGCSLLLARQIRAAASASTWQLQQQLVGGDFYDAFTFLDATDPNSGRVNYVDQHTAISNNYSFASNDSFILRADFNTTLNSTGPGRNSFRLQSNQQFDTHVSIYNIRHMPQGCGTWPALWTVGDTWEADGEIDILEGINNVGPDHATLHFGSQCSMPSQGRSMTGTANSLTCSGTNTADNGCDVTNPSAGSFGPPFNAAGGGWYALSRTNASVQVWFWPRSGTPAPPCEVYARSDVIDTSTWGEPFAAFPNTDCDYTQWGAHNIMINLDFCGSDAGNATEYAKSGCPGTCETYVEQNPGGFVDAYFDFTWIRVYNSTSTTSSAPSATTSFPSFPTNVCTAGAVASAGLALRVPSGLALAGLLAVVSFLTVLGRL